MTHWRADPRLTDRFHPAHPDDLQVSVHDGGPRFSRFPAEIVWVRITGGHGGQAHVYRGTVLNQPFNLQSVAQGHSILLLAPATDHRPFQVSEAYLAERQGWAVRGCDRCGFADLFDLPSALITRTFPDVTDPTTLRAFTSFCPLCGGVQVLERKG
ncbi:MAG: hypothetical protein ACFB51_05410 [Anaerolineae bacterium]